MANARFARRSFRPKTTLAFTAWACDSPVACCLARLSRGGDNSAIRTRELFMASAAEQLAANLSLGTFSKATELKQRIWFTLTALIVYRLGTYIPIPGVDASVMAEMMQRPGEPDALLEFGRLGEGAE